jgi:hypothetical protein
MPKAGCSGKVVAERLLTKVQRRGLGEGIVSVFGQFAEAAIVRVSKRERMCHAPAMRSSWSHERCCASSDVLPTRSPRSG